MKYLALTLALLFLSVPAQAQTPVSKETANDYYANCIKAAPTAGLSAQSQGMLCACTSARLTQFFTMEDMQRMVGNDPNTARPAFNKMLINIYAPCMEAPTREYHYRACITNPQTARLGDPNKLCPCMADAVAQHMTTNGPQVFQEILSRNPNITDPMTALTEDPRFKSFAQSKLLACVM